MKWRRLRFALAAFAGGLAAISVSFVMWAVASWDRQYDHVERPALRASSDPRVVARGEYLFHAVAHCSACHAPAAEVLSLQPGERIVPRGGREWQMGPLGTIRSSNLTSDTEHGIGARSDGDLARVIRHAVRHDGRAARLMFAVGPMADEDLVALISYLRTIPPVAERVPDHDVTVFGKIMFATALRMLARPPGERPIPEFVLEGGVSLERGRYLVHGPGACVGCHSKSDGRAPEPPLLCGNPDPFPDEADPEWAIYAPNLTPHSGTGVLSGMSEDGFLVRAREPRRIPGSPMPWENFREITDDDLRSIFRYLRSLEPCEREIGATHRRRD